MKTRFYLQAFFLITALCGTVYSIYLLNNGHVGDVFTSLGLSTSTANNEVSYNWCTTRVSSIETKDKSWKIFEDDNKWLLSVSGKTFEMDYIAVEKWFANYCHLKIQIYRNPDLLDKKHQALLTINFIDGKSETLYLLDADLYQFSKLSFVSTEMSTALKELHTFVKY